MQRLMDKAVAMSMPATRRGRVFLGVATIWPLVYFFLFIAFFIALTIAGDDDEVGAGVAVPLVVLHVGTMITLLVLIGLYAINVFKNPRIEGDKRTLWAVILFMGSMIAMPVYWYLNVWREPNPATVDDAQAVSR